MLRVDPFIVPGYTCFMCSIRTIGQWLQQLRGQHSLSRMALADKLGVSYNTVLAWENGQNDISRHVVNRLIDLFDLDEVELVKAVKLPRGPAATGT